MDTSTLLTDILERLAVKLPSSRVVAGSLEGLSPEAQHEAVCVRYPLDVEVLDEYAGGGTVWARLGVRVEMGWLLPSLPSEQDAARVGVVKLSDDVRDALVGSHAWSTSRRSSWVGMEVEHAKGSHLLRAEHTFSFFGHITLGA